MRFVYHFDDKCLDSSRELLGNKGAVLFEMKRMGIPIPDGFVITTTACADYYKNGHTLCPKLIEEINDAILVLEEKTKLRFGDSEVPMVVSVRSGAEVSMPGMMDTILNLGLNDHSVIGLAKRTGDEFFAYDSYRRFLHMYGAIVLGMAPSVMNAISNNETLEDVKRAVFVLRDLIEKSIGYSINENPKTLLLNAIECVFRSWNGKRAITYRDIHKISHHGGTAVTVQLMVFGNLKDRSGTGVAFTRNPSDGANEFYGEFMLQAQGEDIVSGAHTPLPISGKNQASMEQIMPGLFEQFYSISKSLEKNYRDMQDIEFTVEKGKLWILQSRNGKRSPRAAVRIALDMLDEGLISTKDVLLRITNDQVNNFLHKEITGGVSEISCGLPASPGAACGAVAFSTESAEKLFLRGPVILCREETSPEDIGGFNISDGILTIKGGMTSHAAVVARGMGKPCVCGVENGFISKGKLIFNDIEFVEGDQIAIDGTSGRIFKGPVELKQTQLSEYFWKLFALVDKEQKMQVRANAEIEQDIKAAMKFGANGIGLCRTEHMFLEKERLFAIRQIILCKSDTRSAAMQRAMDFQISDFISIYKLLEEQPVSIRLLDPPLHEFLPKNVKEIEEFSRRSGKSIAELNDKMSRLAEYNPMLGHRGCRIAITHPEIYKMQIVSIFEAARYVIRNFDIVPNIEIMIPLISCIEELIFIKEMVCKIASEFGEVSYKFGAMIETPRAAIIASEIAKHIDFCSFGTNDLTQAVFGISRDDSYKFMNSYQESNILTYDPFVSIDQDGVGRLIRSSVLDMRASNSNIKIGVCGEHGGDYQSIGFFNSVGIDYISCSPYRIPAAKLASAKFAQETDATN
ncbi:Pyruvate, phosphate dikinase [Candidatus Cyrtobacter comes]|uniref:Pyruvate, phosphate dikinase n=1 Tax=Candidatus Cyrtobacter comes TaxID=675776 RepID=A0ABU5L6D2_9RICK|nr:pyruvate, phosphate dikinase [Candidatus Cyrtobacter comes]MDZ5761687.1 Pyruvate, phosphate dikinase [Candidatus Cyrtobacter comes]